MQNKKKGLGFIAAFSIFLTILLIPPSEVMYYEGIKVVLSHSDSSVFEALKISNEHEIKIGEIKEILEKADDIYIYLPDDFSQSGVKGIKVQDETEITLKELFTRQTSGLKKTLAVAALMAILWITEAIPIPVTALIPILLFPLLSIASPKTISMPGYLNAFSVYLHPLVVLFIAGFTIAEAMKKWNLHKRISLSFIKLIGFSPKRLIFSFMIITALLSMFISNTATTAMMMPIALAIIISIGETPGESQFGKVLMLGIAYAASIGGIGTLIGTPPNVVLAGFVDTLLGIRISFASWMIIGIPIVIVLLPTAFFILLKVFPFGNIKIGGSKQIIEEELKELGRLKGGERNTLIIFIITALLWIFQRKINIWLHIPWLNDAVVGMFGVFLFYIIPVNIKKWEFTMDWKTNEKIPWGTLVLFGGGIALGTALNKTGAASFIASHLTLVGAIPEILMLLVVILLIDFMTEITSNTATTNMMMPILFALGVATLHNPLLLMVGGAVAASMAFMLPVATPPNALVYGTGFIKLKDMVRIGLILDIVAAVIWTIILYISKPLLHIIVR